jgi:transposase
MARDLRLDAQSDRVGVKARGVRVGVETGPLAVWHWPALRQAGLPVVSPHACQAKAALSMQINKTDSNDTHGPAQIVRAGWYPEVQVKSMANHRLKVLLTARARMVTMSHNAV